LRQGIAGGSKKEVNSIFVIERIQKTAEKNHARAFSSQYPRVPVPTSARYRNVEGGPIATLLGSENDKTKFR
jgi:hypothetical protein